MSVQAGEGDRRLNGTRSMQSAAAVTTSDSVNFTIAPCSALWIGGTGNLVVVMNSGDVVTFTAVPAGTWLWLSAVRVNATSTTATAIVALYQMPSTGSGDVIPGWDAPAGGFALVTPSDGSDLPSPARSLYIGATGDVVVDSMQGDTNVKFVAVPTGSILPIRVKRVRSTGTTATAIMALY